MLDHVSTRFRSIGLEEDFKRFVIERSRNTPEISRVDGDTLILADTPLNQEEILESVTYSLGYSKAANFTEAQAQQWSLALVSPSQTRVRTIMRELAKANSYQEALEQIELPVTRLIAVHLFNALSASGASFANAKTADLSQWGATAGLVSGESRYSLLPLLGAYAPTAIFSTYSEALADLVVSNLSSITHSDVRAEFSNLVVSIYNA